MSRPLAGLFGGGGSSQTNPFMVLNSTAAPPPPPTPGQSPIGSPSSFRPSTGSTFMSSAAPAAATGQTAFKTLLGQ